MSRSRRRSAPRTPQPPRAAWVTPHALALLPALLVGALVYAPVLSLFFAQDDVTFLSRAAGLTPTPWSFARPLSEGVIWRVLHALFGLQPFPYHAVRLALHLMNAALVYAIGLRLLRTREAAGAAAFLFAISSLGFTALHWASCIVELSVATFALGALLAFLASRERDSTALGRLASGLALAAVLAKESALALPIIFAIAAFRAPRHDGAVRSLLPVAGLFAAGGMAFLVTRAAMPYGQYVGAAYALNFSPAHLFGEWSRYLHWALTWNAPMRETMVSFSSLTPIIGAAVLAAIAIAIVCQRRDERHPIELGAAWFVIFLLPVLPLENHRYLYYLYVPWAGACWLLASAYELATARWPRAAFVTLAIVVLAAGAAGEWRNVRLRERLLAGPLPADKTLREDLLLRNAVRGLRDAKMAPGSRVGFVNPFPREHSGTRPTEAPSVVHSYIPLEAALRGGDALRLFAPGLEYEGFAQVPPTDWADTELFLFENEGLLTPIGRGGPALRRLEDLMRRMELPEIAEAMRLRAASMDSATARR